MLCTIYILHLKPLDLLSKFVCNICTRYSKINCMKIVIRSQGDTALFTAGLQQIDRMYCSPRNCHPPHLVYTET